MVGQIGKPSMADAGMNVNPAPPSNAAISGASSASLGAPAPKQDAGEVSTDPQFGKVFSEIQAKYGAKTEKPREIKKTLGKDDFLNIMITQMRHQDPTNPFKAEQFASEVAQFTNVEQLQNLNQKMERMTSQNQPLERLAMTNMIGKTITVDRERFVHTEGQNESLSFKLGKDAANVKASIVADNGEVIFEKDMGSLKRGDNNLNWDGLKTNTLRAKTGNYQIKIDAKDANGATIQGQTQVKTRVSGVSFEGSEPVFIVGDINRGEKVSMKNIVRIESDGSAPSSKIPAQQGAGPTSDSASSDDAPKPPSLFTFQKGVGSVPVDVAQLPGEAAKALEKYQNEQNQPKAPVAGADAAAPHAAKPAEVTKAIEAAKAKAIELAQSEMEKGFPNGMSEYNQKGGEKR